GKRVLVSEKFTSLGIKEYCWINASGFGEDNSKRKTTTFKAISKTVKMGNPLDFTESEIGIIILLCSNQFWVRKNLLAEVFSCLSF
ncbi:MAG TPA: hypothetical protein VFA93_02255, partial [Patescibacteria group bacterium]|nr:hypothetical protein [Patescibacteria group bacterium]